MSTDRRQYNSVALYAGPSPATGYHTDNLNTGNNLVKQLHRIQSWNYGDQIGRTDVNIFGKLARTSSEILDPPTVNLSFEYLDANANNESGMGFVVDGTVSFASGIINGSQDDRNYFALIAPDEEDAISNASANTEFWSVGFGNGFVTQYTAQGAVGGFPTCSVNVEALNIDVRTNRTGVAVPSIDFTNGLPVSGPLYTLPLPVTGLGAAALRPGDITVELTADADTQTGIGVLISDAKFQSYNVTANLGREDLKKLGTRFAFSKKITFPAQVSLSLTMDVGDFSTGSLSTFLCNDNNYEARIKLNKPACPGATSAMAKQYILKSMKFDGHDASLAIGGNKSVTMNFSTQISDFTDTSIGLMISGLCE